MFDDADELRHRPDGSPGWREDLVVRFGDGGLAVAVWLTFTADGSAVHRALATGTPVGDVGLVATDITLGGPRTMEVRTDGLWADWVVAEPFRRVGLDAEAFAVTVADGAPLGPDTRGDRVPFGFELDVDSVGPPRAVPGGYRLDVAVSGLLLIGPDELEVGAEGWRGHSWGAPSAAGAAADVLDVGLDVLLGRFELG